MKSRVTGQDSGSAVYDVFPVGPVSAALEACAPESLGRVSPPAERVTLTLESHLPQILRRLRPGADAEQVLEQFGAAIDAARGRGIPVEVEVPLAAENASTLAETITWVTRDGVALVRVVPFRARVAADRSMDVFACFSERYLDRIQALTEQAARDAGNALVWEPRAGRTVGLAHLPGVCEEVWGRVRVDADGVVEPCMYAERGELTLGRIGPDESLQDVWEGPTARDLRRAHLTWDYPAACTSCPRTLGPEMQNTSRFVERFVEEIVGEAGIAEPLEALSPGARARVGPPPVVRVRLPERPIAAWQLVLAPGGDRDHLSVFELEVEAESPQIVRIALPDELWEVLQPNVGYWWAVFGRADDGSWVGMDTARCMIRHQDLERVAGSALRYPSADDELGPWPGPRATGFVTGEYRALVERLRNAVMGAVPAGAVCVVATKGDDGLLSLGEAVGWHFPRTDDGVYAGFNPPDGRWAVEHLEELRAGGAEYLVLPATAFWWREFYPELAEWLRERGRLVLEERDTCLIVALGDQEDVEAAA